MPYILVTDSQEKKVKYFSEENEEVEGSPDVFVIDSKSKGVRRGAPQDGLEVFLEKIYADK